MNVVNFSRNIECYFIKSHATLVETHQAMASALRKQNRSKVLTLISMIRGVQTQTKKEKKVQKRETNYLQRKNIFGVF